METSHHGSLVAARSGGRRRDKLSHQRASCKPAHTQPTDSPRPLRLRSRAAVAPGDHDPRRASERDAIVQTISELAEAAHT
jgi:hypothetical protein